LFQKECEAYLASFTCILCFFASGVGIFFGMLTSSMPSLSVHSAFSGITSSGKARLL